jgi:CoA:oxalate CoA-transferase
MTVKKALEKIRVLDFTRVLAGPYCTMLLADMGAEVIKVEHPKGGDDSRAFGPFTAGESAYFMSLNRNKKSMTLNLKSPRAIELIKKMIPSFDVLVENFRPGVMDKLGIGFEELKKINPRLIYASSSGFGYTGPYSQLPAYDLIVQGMGGLMSISGESEDNPQKSGSSIGDIFAGIFCAVGVLGALEARRETGRGQMIDVAMLDCQVAILENAVSRYLATGVDPKPLGNRHSSITPFATFKTLDGFINIAVGNDSLWEKYCEQIGAKDLFGDERFKTNALRTENWSDLEPLLAAAMKKDSTASWIERLRRVGVPCGPINKVSQVLQDPQVAAREMILEVTHPKAGKQKIPGCPIKMSETPCSVDASAPLLGGDTEAVLSNFLGLSAEEVRSLREEGVL